MRCCVVYIYDVCDDDDCPFSDAAVVVRVVSVVVCPRG